MPTLGPFFRYLRPSHIKNRAQGQKPLGNDPYDDAERVWPRPHKTSPDRSLLHGSINEASESTQHFALPNWTRPHLSRKHTGQSIHAAWDKPNTYEGGKFDMMKDVELQDTSPG